jgi:hypothetical protein
VRYILSSLAVAILALAWNAITPSTAPLAPALPNAPAATVAASGTASFQRQGDTVLASAGASGLDVRVDGQGLRVQHARSGSVTLSLSGLATDGAMRPLPTAAATCDHDVVAERWQGPVQTRIWNRDDGVATIFTVTGEAKAQEQIELSIDLATDGLLAHLNGSDDVQFRTAEGDTRYAYTGPEAEDASGRSLPAQFALVDGKPVLRIDTRGARFPINTAPVLRAVEPMDVVQSAVTPPLQSFMSKVSISVNSLHLRALSPTEAGSFARFGFYNANLDYTLPANIGLLPAKIAAINAAIAPATYAGYSLADRTNFEQGIVVLAAGTSVNRFSPSPTNRGQVSTFKPGRPLLATGYLDDYVAFEVRLDSGPYAHAAGTNLVWLANGKSTTFAHPASYIKVDPTLALSEDGTVVTVSTENEQNVKIEVFGGDPTPLIPIDGQFKDMATFNSTFDPAGDVDIDETGVLPSWSWNRCSIKQLISTDPTNFYYRNDLTMPTKFMPGNQPQAPIDILDSPSYLRIVWALNGHGDAIVIGAVDNG